MNGHPSKIYSSTTNTPSSFIFLNESFDQENIRVSTQYKLFYSKIPPFTFVHQQFSRRKIKLEITVELHPSIFITILIRLECEVLQMSIGFYYILKKENNGSRTRWTL